MHLLDVSEGFQYVENQSQYELILESTRFVKKLHALHAFYITAQTLKNPRCAIKQSLHVSAA
jgi:hypothetical protein